MITSPENGSLRQDLTLARLSTREKERQRERGAERERQRETEAETETETARHRETERTVRAWSLTGVIRLCRPLGHPNKVHKHIIKLNERWDSDEF